MFPRPINPILPLLKENELAAALQEAGEKTALFKASEEFVSLFAKPSGYKIPIDFLLQTHNQCFGITKGGKSEGMAKLCEELLVKKVKLCILDSSKADFVSLTELPLAR
jgi:hypothetical protein